MRIVFMGTPDFAVPSLKRLIADGHQVVAVYTQPDKPKNRGMKLTPPSVKVVAMEHDIPVLQPVKVREPQVLEQLAAFQPELIVVVAYGKILPREIFELPPMGCINVHSSLLPKYRGAAPINWAVINGDEETGVTIMDIAEALDAGDMETASKELDLILGLRDLYIATGGLMAAFTHSMNLLGCEGWFATDYNTDISDESKEKVTAMMKAMGEI